MRWHVLSAQTGPIVLNIDWSTDGLLFKLRALDFIGCDVVSYTYMCKRFMYMHTWHPVMCLWNNLFLALDGLQIWRIWVPCITWIYINQRGTTFKKLHDHSVIKQMRFWVVFCSKIQVRRVSCHEELMCKNATSSICFASDVIWYPVQKIKLIYQLDRPEVVKLV